MPRLLPGSASPSWVAAETLGAALTSLFGLLFIARLIGPAEAGTGAIAASIFLTLDLPLSALFGDALLQRRALEERHRASAMAVTLLASALVAAGLVAAAPLLAGLLGVAALQPMVQVLALLLPISAAAGLLSALALRGQRFRLLALRVLLCQPLAIGIGILVAVAGGGAWAMVAQQAIATLAVCVLLALGSGWWPKLVLERQALAELWPVAGPQILALLIYSGRYRIFIVGLGLLVAEAVVAVTHVAFRLLDVAMAAVTNATTRLAMPRLAALQHEPLALAEAYGDLAQLQALVGLPVAVGLAIVAPQLILLLMGEQWGAAGEPARWVALGAIPVFLVGPAAALFLALGRTTLNLVLQALAFAVPLLLLFVIRPRDPAGAAMCWVGGSLAVAPVQAVLVLRAARRGPLWLAERLAAPVVATLAMACIAEVALRAAGPAGPLPSLLAAAVPGALVYVLVATLALGRQWPRALKEA
jgi:O-antigen/teichoic acid export membrane protein